MKNLAKNTVKFAIATCAAAGVVALVVSGAAVGAAAEGIQAAKNSMKKTFTGKQKEADTVEEAEAVAEVEAVEVIQGGLQEKSEA